MLAGCGGVSRFVLGHREDCVITSVLRRIGAVAAVSCTALLSASSARAQAALSLDDAIRFALSRNERARVADLQTDVADAAVDRARSGFLPVVTVTAAGTQRGYETVRGGSVITPYNTGSGSFLVNQPLLNVPAFPIYRQAQRLLDAQKFQAAEDKRSLMFDAARAFMVVLSEQQVLQAANRRVDLAKAGLGDAQARVEAQLNGTNDVTRAQVELASAEREVETDRGLLERALLQLAFVLNTKVLNELSPPSPTLRAAEQTVSNVDALVGEALPRRHDIVASHHRAVAARIFATEPMMRLVPTIGLQAQGRLNTVAGAAGRIDDETLGLTLTWTLYDAGIRYADKRSRDAQAQIAELDLSTLKRNVDTQVRVAVAALVSAQAAFRVAAVAVEASRKSVEETAILYRQGLARAIEVTDASGARFVAEVNYAVAQFSMAQAYLDLRFALGLEPLGTELR